MTPMEELREQAAKIAPCPFCGENLRHSSHKGVEFWMHPGVVTDDDCVLSGKGFYPKELAAWKRRALPTPVALPQAGEVADRDLIFGWLMTMTDEKYRDQIRGNVDRGEYDNMPMMDVARYVRAALSTPTETPTAAAPDDGLAIGDFRWTDNLTRHKAAHRSVMANVSLGKWMSAALDDPNVCDEMKADIREWFSAGEPMEALSQLIDVFTPDDGLMGRYREALEEARRGFDAVQVLMTAMAGGRKSSMVETFAEKIDAALSTATGDEGGK